ncbi:hypothetical protein [Sagittula sp. MA-2]|jgi:hypothetical protein|uniref:hypothetical protein n=1 Tax=Sagittula sp. MA-2 TaxID=3048007 RepID=UPI0024C248C4|nr:hypothetical protein [Sagittula sp. MA-2]WHZ33431.1 hypothetical protein QNI11_12285 [Sagittula sp. MA-2]
MTTEAERKIRAIDLRIDAIVAELHRQKDGRDDAGYALWENHGALAAFHSAAYIRRAEWVEKRDNAALEAERAAFREYRRNLGRGAPTVSLERCAHCGSAIRSAV